MTPPALTPAARGTKSKSAPKRNGGHRSTIQRPSTPPTPRRVSGPAGGVAHGQTPRGRAQTAPRTRSRPGIAERAGASARAPLSARPLAYVRALPDRALLDRIIRGRGWIPLLGVLLAGIVAMQVEVLKLNAGIGRSLERGTALQSQNELLRASVTRLADEQRIERIAAGMGMVMPAPEQIKFLDTGPAVTNRALGNIHAPNATGFVAHLPTASAAVAGTSTGVAAAGTVAPATSTGVTGTSTAAPTYTGGTVAATGGVTSTPQSTSVPVTPTGTTTPAGGATSTPQSPVTPAGTGASGTTAAPSTPVGGSTQSGSATGGVGASPVGG
jgi:hypothetical protein